MWTHSIAQNCTDFRIRRRLLYLVLSLSVFAIPALADTPLLIAGMLGDSGAEQQDRNTPLQHATPVVQDSNGNVIGLFAGITDVPADLERLQTAFLALSASGYLLPVLPSGKVIALQPLYFLSRDCSGTAYAESAATHSYPAHPGLVFRLPASQQLYYISRYAEPVTLETHSAWQIEQDGQRQCVEQLNHSEYLEAIKNSSVTTEIQSLCCTGPVAIKVLNHREAPQPSSHRDSEKWPGNSSESLQAEEPDEQVYECSPGCTAADIGDGLCDIKCYNDACRFDDGDCNQLNEDELQKQFDKLCSPGCFKADVGDGFCDSSCNVPACGYDDGDCADDTH